VFLSYEDHRGPLTVNLKGDLAPLKKMTTVEVFLISPELISASEGNIHISLEQAMPWQPIAPSSSHSLITDRHQRLQALAQNAYAQKPKEGLSGLIALGLEGTSTHPQKEDFLMLRSTFQNDDIINFTQHISSMLGLGSGLTPSWDDFTLGMLLCLNRWEHILQPRFDLESLNSTLVQNAYPRTTTISANLIECATLGQADERLINALDYIVIGTGDQAQILNGLLSWGNSSGIDALLGMLFAFDMLKL